MSVAVYFLLFSVIVVGIIWRFASRHRTLPCPVWFRWVVELDNPFTKTNRAKVIVDHLCVQNGMTVLDAGCGPGRLTIPLAERVGESREVVALDIQAGMVKRAQDKARGANLTNIRFIQAGLGAGKLDRDQFDLAVLVTVLGEIRNCATALCEIFQSRKPGGVLSVTEIIFDPHFQSRNTVTRPATEAGFEATAFFGNRVILSVLLGEVLTYFNRSMPSCFNMYFS